MSGRVFVTQQPRPYKGPDGTMREIDLTPALDYGSVEVLIEDGRQANVLNTASLVRELRAKLTDYDDGDFILASGDPVLIGIACAVAAVANRGRLCVLKWDRRETRYYPCHIDVLGA